MKQGFDENYCNRKALEAALEFEGLGDDSARQFVPHLLEHLIADGEPDVATEAAAVFARLREDDSESVRGEVAESISRLKRKGKW